MMSDRRASDGPPIFTFFWTGTLAAMATGVLIAVGWAGYAVITDPPRDQLVNAVMFSVILLFWSMAVAWPVWMMGLYTVGLAAWFVLRRRDVGPAAASLIGAALAGTAAFIWGCFLFQGGPVREWLPIAIAIALAVAACGAGVGWAALRRPLRTGDVRRNGGAPERF